LRAFNKLNADYNAKFGFPFRAGSARAPRHGLAKQQIIDTFERRLANPRTLSSPSACATSTALPRFA
jgi:2-oxo-4-hydroxy-4-carboxy--5-ureidoimidazoline (OHCU) decarboxylase